MTHGFLQEGRQLLSVSAPTCGVGSWPPQGAHPPWRMKACLSGPAPSPRPQPRAAYHILNDFIFPVLPLYFEQVVTEVEQVKATLLAQQDDDGAAGPVQAVSETLPGSGRGSSWGERVCPSVAWHIKLGWAVGFTRFRPQAVYSCPFSCFLTGPSSGCLIERCGMHGTIPATLCSWEGWALPLVPGDSLVHTLKLWGPKQGFLLNSCKLPYSF